MKTKAKFIYKGGPGSGNFGHAGRPGKIGGSGSSTAQPPTRDDIQRSKRRSDDLLDDYAYANIEQYGTLGRPYAFRVSVSGEGDKLKYHTVSVSDLIVAADDEVMVKYEAIK